MRLEATLGKTEKNWVHRFAEGGEDSLQETLSGVQGGALLALVALLSFRSWLSEEEQESLNDLLQ